MYHSTNEVSSDFPRLLPRAARTANAGNTNERDNPSDDTNDLEIIDLTSSEAEENLSEYNDEHTSAGNSNQDPNVNQDYSVTVLEELTDNEGDVEEEANETSETPTQDHTEHLNVSVATDNVNSLIHSVTEDSQDLKESLKHEVNIEETIEDPQHHYSLEELDEKLESENSIEELHDIPENEDTPEEQDQNSNQYKQSDHEVLSEEETKETTFLDDEHENESNSQDESRHERDTEDRDDKDSLLEQGKADHDEIITVHSDRRDSLPSENDNKHAENFDKLEKPESLLEDKNVLDGHDSTKSTQDDEKRIVEVNANSNGEPVSEIGLSLEVIPMPIFIRIKGDDYLLVPFYKQTKLDLEGTVALFDDKEALGFSVEGFFASIRSNEDLVDIYGFEENDELTLKIPELDDLFITEDNVYSSDIGIWDFAKAFITLKLNSSERSAPPKLTIEISTQERFITKFNKLTECIHTGKGFNEIDAVLNEKKSGEKRKLEDDNDESPPDNRKKSKIII